MRTPFYLVSILVITLLSQITNAQEANITAVAGFLECLRMFNATGYAYNVTLTGELVIAPLANVNSHADVDIRPYKACTCMFGINFYCSFDFGVRTFHPDYELLDLADATAEELIGRGMIARALL